MIYFNPQSAPVTWGVGSGVSLVGMQNRKSERLMLPSGVTQRERSG